MMLSRLGELNAFPTYDILNLQWVYRDITPMEGRKICSLQPLKCSLLFKTSFSHKMKPKSKCSVLFQILKIIPERDTVPKKKKNSVRDGHVEFIILSCLHGKDFSISIIKKLVMLLIILYHFFPKRAISNFMHLKIILCHLDFISACAGIKPTNLFLMDSWRNFQYILESYRLLPALLSA